LPPDRIEEVPEVEDERIVKMREEILKEQKALATAATKAVTREIENKKVFYNILKTYIKKYSTIANTRQYGKSIPKYTNSNTAIVKLNQEFTKVE
jgi:hypothetical protein